MPPNQVTTFACVKGAKDATFFMCLRFQRPCGVKSVELVPIHVINVSRRKMKHRRFVLSFGLLPVLISGCAAIGGRIDEGGGHPYLGVRGDAYSVAHPGDAMDPLEVPFCILDMP